MDIVFRTPDGEIEIIKGHELPAQGDLVQLKESGAVYEVHRREWFVREKRIGCQVLLAAMED